MSVAGKADGRTNPGAHQVPCPPEPRGRRGRKRLRMESKVTIGEGKAAFPPGGAGGGRRAEGTCRGRFLSSFPVPPSRPPPPHPHPYSRRPRQLTLPVPARFLSSESPAGPRAACGARPRRAERDARRPPGPAARPTGKVSTRGRGLRRAGGPGAPDAHTHTAAAAAAQELKPRAAELGPRLEPPVLAARNRCPGRAALGAQRALPGAVKGAGAAAASPDDRGRDEGPRVFRSRQGQVGGGPGGPASGGR